MIQEIFYTDNRTYIKGERGKENDIEVFIEILSEYGFDIEETYDYKETTVQDTAITIIDRMNQIFSLW